jgi:hypothetical protein
MLIFRVCNAPAKDFAKVKDNRFKNVRFVKEGRLWPPKLVAGLASLAGGEAERTGGKE